MKQLTPPTGQIVTTDSPAGLSVRDVLAAFFRRKYLLIVVFLVVAATSAALLLLLPKSYESRMKILVKNTRQDAAITPGQTDVPTLSRDVTEMEINSEMALLGSRDLLQQVVERTGLVEEQKVIPGENRERQIDRAVRELEKHLSINPLKKANIIEVSYTGSSPEQSAAVLRQLSELYMEKHLKLHSSVGMFDFFSKQAKDYNDQLADAQQRLTQFQQNRSVGSLGEQKTLNLQRTAEAQVKLQEAETELSDLKKRAEVIAGQLAALPERILTQSRSLPNQYSVERLTTMLVEMQNKRTQLLTKFQPDDRFVVEIDQQIAETKQALAQVSTGRSTEQATDNNPLRQTLEGELARVQYASRGLQARRDTIAGQIASYRAEMAGLERVTPASEALVRSVKESEENYLLFAKKREEARITDALDKEKITNVSLAEAPTVSYLAAGPGRGTSAALTLFLASFVAVGSVIAAEMFRETVGTPRELEAFVGRPVLATVPDANKNRRQKYLADRSRLTDDFDDQSLERRRDREFA